MRYIGIDPGTHCGWAVLSETGERIASGVWNLSPGRHEGGGMRFLRLEKYLDNLLVSPSLGYRIAYEEVRRHVGTDAAHIYGGVIATLTRYCEEYNLPYRGIPVGTIKKVATGKGNASKDAMTWAALAHWKMETCAEDEADALWCAEALRLELTTP